MARARGKRYSEVMMEKRLRFRDEFSVELDIFDSGESFPEWIYRFREPLLDKISKPVKQLASLLKGCGIEFKLKWPLSVNGTWKFADIYIPSTDTVIVVTTKADYLRPSLFQDEKAEFFRQSHNVRQFDYDVFDRSHEEIIGLIEELGVN